MGLHAHFGLVLSKSGASLHIRSMLHTKETLILVHILSGDNNGFNDIVALFMDSLIEFGIVMNPIRCIIDNKLKLVP